jgi:hypothetical protein
MRSDRNGFALFLALVAGSMLVVGNAGAARQRTTAADARETKGTVFPYKVKSVDRGLFYVREKGQPPSDIRTDLTKLILIGGQPATLARKIVKKTKAADGWRPAKNAQREGITSGIEGASTLTNKCAETGSPIDLFRAASALGKLDMQWSELAADRPPLTPREQKALAKWKPTKVLEGLTEEQAYTALVTAVDSWKTAGSNRGDLWSTPGLDRNEVIQAQHALPIEFGAIFKRGTAEIDQAFSGLKARLSELQREPTAKGLQRVVEQAAQVRKLATRHDMLRWALQRFESRFNLGQAEIWLENIANEKWGPAWEAALHKPIGTARHPLVDLATQVRLVGKGLGVTPE